LTAPLFSDPDDNRTRPLPAPAAPPAVDLFREPPADESADTSEVAFVPPPQH